MLLSVFGAFLATPGLFGAPLGRFLIDFLSNFRRFFWIFSDLLNHFLKFEAIMTTFENIEKTKEKQRFFIDFPKLEVAKY